MEFKMELKQEMKDNKKVIFLDLWETVLFSNPNNLNINYDRGEIISNITNSYDAEFWKNQIIEEIKRFKTEELNGISIKPLQRIKNLLEYNNISSEFASQIIKEFDELIIKKYMPTLNKALLNDIKEKGEDIYIISNSGLTTKYAIIETLKHYNVLGLFKNTYFSEDYEYCKPNILFYKTVLDENDIKPEDVLMLGDNENMDYKPCQKLGIKCIIKKWSNI